VQFYPSPVKAEAAGFRECLRCLPKSPPLLLARSTLIETACRTIASNPASTLALLARSAGMSAFNFHREFKRVTGLTTLAYKKASKVSALKEKLSAGVPVLVAALSAGIESSHSLYGPVAIELGMPPGQYSKGAPGMLIQFGISASTLGDVLIATSRLGVCAILLGERELLIKELYSIFPAATITLAGPEFAPVMSAAIALSESPEKTFSLPLDIRGTIFQRRVWQELRKIPPGKSKSYSEIAMLIGKPKAARAVAGACAANKLALAIPCHRCLGINGSPSGYRWGVQRKLELLRRERRSA
jgi:AraC family transcriptional regulator of adaptative response/methylated-DNA-[protein]-cysteine methyltransferase